MQQRQSPTRSLQAYRVRRNLAPQRMGRMRGFAVRTAVGPTEGRQNAAAPTRARTPQRPDISIVVPTGLKAGKACSSCPGAQPDCRRSASSAESAPGRCNISNRAGHGVGFSRPLQEIGAIKDDLGVELHCHQRADVKKSRRRTRIRENPWRAPAASLFDPRHQLPDSLDLLGVNTLLKVIGPAMALTHAVPQRPRPAQSRPPHCHVPKPQSRPRASRSDRQAAGWRGGA